MSTSCKYCNESEDKQYRPGLVCETCMCFVHLNCLRRPGTPGDLAGDIFFDFTCTECSLNHKEIFKRNKFPWVNVIVLTLHHLSSQAYGISNHGYFHYKTHICSFIDRNWGILFGPHFKQKKNWVGTIAGALSVHGGGLLFRAATEAAAATGSNAGAGTAAGAGWWRLAQPFSPALAAHLLQEIARDRPKGRMKSQLALDKNIFLDKVVELGYTELLDAEETMLPPPTAPACATSPAPAFLHGADGDAFFYSDYELDARLPTLGMEEIANADADADIAPDCGPRPVVRPVRRSESLFSCRPNSADPAPWFTPTAPTTGSLVSLSEYEEIHLLKQMSELERRARGECSVLVARLRARLRLRRLQRHRGLTLFCFDTCVRSLGGVSRGGGGLTAERLLDRFHRQYAMEQLSGCCGAGGARLLWAGGASAGAGAGAGELRPYIRRDTNARPPHLRLMEELLRRTHRDEVDYKPHRGRGVDYMYLSPGHLAAVNALLADCFWPGVELADCLQRRSWCVVAVSGRLVVGVGALVGGEVPSEAYLAFLAVRPAWRRAGIARFMLYHLLQTCSDMDVTLHVSPTNPAIFLYQKFGFKVEEFIQDFYEKYYDIDYKGCRHALFLRLAR